MKETKGGNNPLEKPLKAIDIVEQVTRKCQQMKVLTDTGQVILPKEP